jgi:hypothetical protein
MEVKREQFCEVPLYNNIIIQKHHLQKSWQLVDQTSK